MRTNAHATDPDADLVAADERLDSTRRIFALLGIAGAVFWGGIGLALYALF